MSLERLVAEITSRAESELAAEQARVAAEEATITAERDGRIAELRASADHRMQAESARERATRLASAKIQAKRMLYAAREQRIGASLERVRALLADFAIGPEYAPTLKRMYAHAQSQLGKGAKVYGRAADASVLRTVAGKAFQDDAVPIVGGLIAESADGSRRLNLSFDELLRLREDRVRALLAA